MASKHGPRIALIIGSQRPKRIAPEVVSFMLNTLNNPSIERIDLATVNLPFFNEPGIPQHITSISEYEHEHTRRWAEQIASFDAFIFLSAQRNWGIPAELKNCIDYLYRVWRGKPAGLITYGGRGGEQCCDQLRTVLGSIGVNILEKQVNMKIPRDRLSNAFAGEMLGLDASDDGSVWAEHRSDFAALYDDLIAALQPAKDEAK